MALAEPSPPVKTCCQGSAVACFAASWKKADEEQSPCACVWPPAQRTISAQDTVSKHPRLGQTITAHEFVRACLQVNTRPLATAVLCTGPRASILAGCCLPGRYWEVLYTHTSTSVIGRESHINNICRVLASFFPSKVHRQTLVKMSIRPWLAVEPANICVTLPPPGPQLGVYQYSMHEPCFDDNRIYRDIYCYIFFYTLCCDCGALI